MEESTMDAISFRTIIDGEQVIRPPTGVVLPQGTFEVLVKPVGDLATISETARADANERLRRHRVSLGHATGTDNEAIDDDLARVYGADGDAPGL
jgi:hypothetical protein